MIDDGTSTLATEVKYKFNTLDHVSSYKWNDISISCWYHSTINHQARGKDFSKLSEIHFQ